MTNKSLFLAKAISVVFALFIAMTGICSEMTIPASKGKIMMKSSRTRRPRKPLKNYIRKFGKITYAQTWWEIVWFKIPETCPKGSYYFGINAVQKENWKENNPHDWIYHNGQLFHLDNWTQPQKNSDGIYKATAYHNKPLTLKPGDVIGVRFIVIPWTGIELRKTLPPLSNLACASNFGWRRAFPKTYPNIKLAVHKEGESNPNKREEKISITCFNYSPKEQNVDLSWKLCDFYGKILKSSSEKVKLSSLGEVEKEIIVKIPDSLNHAQFIASAKTKNGKKVTGCADIILNRTKGPRPRIYLDGRWDFASDDRLFLETPPATEMFKKKLPVPGWLKLDKPAYQHIGWFLRKVTIPENFTRGRYLLHFDNVQYECKAFVNGKEVGVHSGPNDAFEFDVTDALKVGENEIVVGVRDWIAAVSPDALKKADRSKEWQIGSFRDFISPVSGDNRPFPRGIFGSVWLEARPEVSISDVFLRPSFRRKQLDVDITILNNSNKKITVTPSVSILDKGNIIGKSEEKPISLSPGEAKTETLSCNAEKFPLWWPHSPHLLQCKIALKGSEDVRDVRFGFREVWFEGADLLFNGQPLHAIRGHGGGSYGPPNIESEREHIKNKFLSHDFAVHLSEAPMPKPPLANIADEEGDLLDLETNSWLVRPITEKLVSDIFWKNATKMAIETVKTFRNNPSVIHYDHANEFACYSPYTNVDNGFEYASRRLGDLIEAVKKVDPTRAGHADADGDLNGRTPDMNIHYPETMNPFSKTHAGNSFLIPVDIFNSWFVKPRQDFFPRKGDVIKTKTNGIPVSWKYGIKPACAAEVLWYKCVNLPKGAAIFGGDQIFNSTGAAHDMEEERTNTFINGFRHLGLWMIHPWTCMGQASAPGDCVVPIEQTGNFFSGENFVRHCNIHHDYLYPTHLKLRWLLSINAKNINQGDETLDLKGGDLLRKTLAFKLPQVDKETPAELVFELMKGSELVFSTKQNITVFPKKEAFSSLTQPVLLWDPQGSSQAVFKNLGVDFVAISDLNKIPAGNNVLVVGVDAFNKENDSIVSQKLFDYVKQGHVVVLLQQKYWPVNAPMTLKIVKNHLSSKVWIRAPKHPALRNIKPEYLRNWRNNHVVASHDFSKPVTGNITTLADSGCKHGLERACLLDIKLGKGEILATQMRLIEAFNKEPAARLVLANLLNAAENQAKKLKPLQSIQVISEQSSPLIQLFNNMKVKYDIVKLPLDKQNLKSDVPVILQLNDKLSKDDAQILKNFVASGGFLWIRGVSKKTIPMLNLISGENWQVTEEVLPQWKGRAIIIDNALEIAGLSNQEFFWKQNNSNAVEDPKAKFADIAIANISPVNPSKNLKQLLDPESMWLLTEGKGRILIDQVSWAENAANVNITNNAKRIASSVLTSWNIEVAPPVSISERPLPKKLEWVPVDLSTWGNMAFTDDTESDGKGGWTDQGPNMDMKNFPTGEQVFNEVPFFIHPKKGCLTLCGKNQPAKEKILFELKGIPVNRKILAFEVLHTGAWVSSGAGTFTVQINYDDGTHARVPFTGGINSCDWTDIRYDSTFTLESDTKTRSAWVGPGGGVFPLVGILQSRWVNPHPEKKVKSIDFIRTNYAIRYDGLKLSPAVALIGGLTLGVEGSGKELDPRSPRELLEAIDKAKKAKNNNEMLKLVRILCKKAPDQTENWNLLGDIQLDLMENKVEALKAYKKSLKINWNQPATIKKVEELEKLLKN